MASPVCDKRCLSIFMLVVLGVALSPSCSGGEGERRGVDWRTGLESLDETDVQLFSLSFVDTPPEGTILHVAVLDPQNVQGLSGSDDASCALFDSTTQNPARPNFWYLKLALSGTTPGTYTVVPELDESAPTQASVRLVQVKDWNAKAQAVDALAGTIELQAGPEGVGAWHAGEALVATVHAQFPANPLRRLGCRSQGPTDGSEIFRECTCEDLQGNQTTCEPEAGQQDCCYNDEGPMIAYELDVVAAPCAAMCRATSPPLYRYCEELR